MSRMTAPIRVAVVGHTNTGKTSLLRTLTRDADFGAVANRPSTTRHVEGAALIVNGQPLIEFYDTPGLEDSISLLESLEITAEQQGNDNWVELINAFLDKPEAHGRFAQEAKSLRQVLACAIVLYVIDVRDRVLGKYRDELTILIRSAKPIIPLLNFVDSPDARTPAWQDHLARYGLHASLRFNPLIVDALAERKLFEKMRALHDELYEPLGDAMQELERQRERLRRVGLDLIADMLLDVAACTINIVLKNSAEHVQKATELGQAVQAREWRCAKDLLRLHGFHSEDYQPEDILPDDPETGGLPLTVNALKNLGARGGSGAAAGAAVGMAFDVMLGGLSLGAGTATGAGLGALFNVRSQSVRLINKVRGIGELRISDATLALLAARQLTLAQALLRRGHADPRPVQVAPSLIARFQSTLRNQPLVALQTARLYPAWSPLGAQLNHSPQLRSEAAPARETAKTELTQALGTVVGH